MPLVVGSGESGEEYQDTRHKYQVKLLVPASPQECLKEEYVVLLVGVFAGINHQSKKIIFQPGVWRNVPSIITVFLKEVDAGTRHLGGRKTHLIT